MKRIKGSVIYVTLAFALAVSVGCFLDDDDETVTPNLSGQYDLDQTLSGPNNCVLGDPMSVPIRVEQTGNSAVITNGTVPGPDVCGAQAQGNVSESGVLPATGEVTFLNYFGEGCDLIQTNEWSLTVAAGGSVTGTWSVSYGDSPDGCWVEGGFLPCTNDYTISGTRCDACFESCSAPAKRAPTNWGIR